MVFTLSMSTIDFSYLSVHEKVLTLDKSREIYLVIYLDPLYVLQY